MRFLLPLLALLATASAATGQEMNPDDPFFELINPSNKPAPGAPSTPTIPAIPPTETAAMLKKWEEYEKNLTAKLNNNISAGRRVAKEILVRQALAAPASAREALATEAARLETMPQELALGAGEPNSKIAKEAALLGKWEGGRNYKPELFPGGLIINGDGKMEPWRWIDPAAGLVSLGSKFSNLLWMADSARIKGINGFGQRYSLKKIRPNQPRDKLILNVLAKLQRDEIAQRQALDNDLDAKRRRLVAWLLSKAREIPIDQSAELLPKISALEMQTDDGVSKLAGIWAWDTHGFVKFLPGGIVGTKTGGKLGTWGWALENQTRFAVTLNNGKTANDIFVANAPRDAADLSTTVYRMGEGEFKAVRVMP